ncbi:type II secretion system F family protein [Saccharothrix coeruleofusca]|uniref:type II secretion system F family protein n=1 Tax=Saccharothrix coeruleofusca TaxID=33919 RepID=UPI001670D36F|nr:type II secretion system F family protein [Saccharothrix coeruleofusca]
MPLIVLAAALAALPPPRAHRRLRALRPEPRRRWRWRRPGTPVVAVAGALLGLVAGVGGALAGALLASVLWREHRDRVARRDRLAATAALAAGLKAFTAELRAGAHPAAAAANTAEDCAPPAAEVFDTIATTAARGGDVEAALAHTDAAPLARAWRLADAHGVPLAGALEAVGRDLDRRAAFARQVRARMAGPRASVAVLAALPVFGLLLGEFSGAGPVQVLRTTLAGQVLLVLGAVLVCAGLRWCAHLTGEAPG